MPVPRSILSEYRFLDEKRRAEGLSSDESARWAELRELADADAPAPGFDVNAAADELRASLDDPLAAGPETVAPVEAGYPGVGAPSADAAGEIAEPYAPGPAWDLSQQPDPPDPLDALAWDPAAPTEAGAYPLGYDAAPEPPIGAPADSTGYDATAFFPPGDAGQPGVPWDPPPAGLVDASAASVGWDPTAPPYDPSAVVDASAYPEGYDLSAAPYPGPEAPAPVSAAGYDETSALTEGLADDPAALFAGLELAPDPAPLGESEPAAVAGAWTLDDDVLATAAASSPAPSAMPSGSDADARTAVWELPVADGPGVIPSARHDLREGEADALVTAEWPLPEPPVSSAAAITAEAFEAGDAATAYDFAAESAGSFIADAALSTPDPVLDPPIVRGEAPGAPEPSAPSASFSESGISQDEITAPFDLGSAPARRLDFDPDLGPSSVADAPPIDLVASAAALPSRVAAPEAAAPLARPAEEIDIPDIDVDEEEIPVVEAEEVVEEAARARELVRGKPASPPAPSVAPISGPPATPGSGSASYVAGTHRVVIHTVDGQVKRGAIADVDLDGPEVDLVPQPGAAPERVDASRIKAIFFMLPSGAKPLAPEGKRVRVTFADGRQVAGFAADLDGPPTGFFVVPADPRTHTARIWVYRGALRQVSVS